MRRSAIYLPLCPVCRRLYLATFAEQAANECAPCAKKAGRP